MAEYSQKPIESMSLEHLEKLVADVLRNANDYAYLGGHEFASFMYAAIERHSAIKEAGEFITEVDKGKALRNLVLIGVNKFRPPGPQPNNLTKEWETFVILYDEYILEKQTNDIMSELGLNEGKFFRKRRYAVKCVAALLRTMEEQAEGWKTK